MGALRSSLGKATTTEIRRWAWYSWVKWYALAVALAELCVSQQAIRADDKWDVVVPCFDRYATLVADGRTGLLWAPIKRPMAKARLRHESSSPKPVQQAAMAYLTVPPRCHKRSVFNRMDCHHWQMSLFLTLQHWTPSQVQYFFGEDRSEENGSHLFGDNSLEFNNADSAWLNWELFIDGMNLR